MESDCQPGASGVSSSVSVEKTAPLREIEGYRIERELGRGGMGAVYEAVQISTGRRVALKTIKQSLAAPGLRERFQREGRLAAAINHPNTVYVFSAEEFAGEPLIVMELVSGGTLADAMKRRGQFPVAEAVDAILQVVAGLEAAAQAGVLHRDVKPSNCFVAEDGTIKVGDFGLSVSSRASPDSQLTATGTLMGTPSYSAPEQLRGNDVDLRADIYSVGATLYSLLAGHPPFRGKESVQVLAAVFSEEPANLAVVRDEIPEDLAQVVARCLAKRREKRFANYVELRDALLPFSSLLPDPAPLGRRLMAGVIDTFVAWLPICAVLIAFGKMIGSSDPQFFQESVLGTAPTSLRPIASMIDSAVAFIPTFLGEEHGGAKVSLGSKRIFTDVMVLVGALVSYLLYHVVLEGRFGAGIGKKLLGLRVVGPSGGAPGMARSAARAVMTGAVAYCGYALTIFQVLGDEPLRSLPPLENVWQDWIPLILWALLFASARSGNGFAAVHDLITNTAVVIDESVVAHPLIFAEPEQAAGGDGEKVGPYRLLGKITDKVALAYDPLLRRQVWLHASVSPVSSRRRELARRSRLRWLGEFTSGDRRWQITEAPGGVRLLDLPEQSQPWIIVRACLAGLAAEFDAAAVDGTLPQTCSLANIWMAAAGRAILLDEPTGEYPGSEKFDLRRAEDVQRFLEAMADHLLDRRALPLHAGDFLRKVGARQFANASEMVSHLESLLAKPAEVTRTRRLASIFFTPALWLVCGALASLALSYEQYQADQFGERYPEHESLPTAITAYRLRRDPAVAQFIARRHGSLIKDPSFDLAAGAVLNARERQLARTIVNEASSSDASPFGAADRIKKRLARTAGIKRALIVAIVPMTLLFGMGAGAVLHCFGVQLTGSSLGLRLFGLTIVNFEGAQAGRAELLIRGLILQTPLLLFSVVSLRLMLASILDFRAAIPSDPLSRVLFVSIPLLVLAVPIRLALRPKSAIAGTYVAPL